MRALIFPGCQPYEHKRTVTVSVISQREVHSFIRPFDRKEDSASEFRETIVHWLQSGEAIQLGDNAIN